jgi:heme-degrading monooxygenase HmoA
MYTVIAHLKFQDFGTWKKGFDATTDLRAAAGMRNVRPFRNVENANEAIVISDADDLERVKAFFTSPEARAGFERAGMTAAPVVQILEPV